VIRTISAIAALAATAALVAGCGGGGNGSAEGGAYGNEAKAETTQAAQTESATTVSVGTAAGAGKVLVDAEGLTLYYFEKDTKGGKSACYGACASAWPPLTGTPRAKGGAESSKLGTTQRKDGTTQVTYAGWPLYTYAGDTKPGEDNGTDSKAFGAPWYPLHPNGEKAGE
jgi:predicted lipoprotein with Yx(FWY)xxD motif